MNVPAAMKLIVVLLGALLLFGCGKKADPEFPPDVIANPGKLPEHEYRGYR